MRRYIRKEQPWGEINANHGEKSKKKITIKTFFVHFMCFGVDLSRRETQWEKEIAEMSSFNCKCKKTIHEAARSKLETLCSQWKHYCVSIDVGNVNICNACVWDKLSSSWLRDHENVIHQKKLNIISKYLFCWCYLAWFRGDWILSSLNRNVLLFFMLYQILITN